MVIWVTAFWPTNKKSIGGCCRVCGASVVPHSSPHPSTPWSQSNFQSEEKESWLSLPHWIWSQQLGLNKSSLNKNCYTKLRSQNKPSPEGWRLNWRSYEFRIFLKTLRFSLFWVILAYLELFRNSSWEMWVTLSASKPSLLLLFHCLEQCYCFRRAQLVLVEWICFMSKYTIEWDLVCCKVIE